MINNLLSILFYIVWTPICILLIGGVMLWAILYTWVGYIISFIKKCLNEI